jgi:carbonic anhydrase
MSERLAKGVTRFRRGYFRRNRERYAELVREGQTPHALFITCADSRVLPHAMTGTDPGELFVLRNVGNMVPPWAPTSECAAVGSAIEYAVQVLGVADIVVCGHSHCGACAALYADEQDDMQLTAKWLRQGDRVRELVIEKTGLDDEGLRSALRSRERRAQLLRATERAMVVQHLSNLMTYPAVAGKVEAEELNLHGWYYTLESGEIERYDPDRLAFLPLQRPPAGLPAPPAP